MGMTERKILHSEEKTFLFLFVRLEAKGPSR